MKKKLEDLIQQFEKSKTSFESYEIISEFTKIIIDFPEFIEQIEKESDILVNAQKRNNADKGWDLPRKEKKHHNEIRDAKNSAFHELNYVFPLRNLHNVLIATQIENIPDNVDWLYRHFSPDKPMPDHDKKEYLKFMNKLYKKILPFLSINKPSIPKKDDDLLFKKYDETTRSLHIGKYIIPIAKNKGNNNMHEVMAYIFIDNKDDISEEFSYAEMAEDRFGAKYNPRDKYAHQPYSGACKRINDKIQFETNGKIRDFLIYSTSKVGGFSVNEKYLK